MEQQYKKYLTKDNVIILAIIIAMIFILPIVIRIIRNLLNPVEKLTEAVKSILSRANLLNAVSAGGYATADQYPKQIQDDIENTLKKQMDDAPSGYKRDDVITALNEILNHDWITKDQYNDLVRYWDNTHK